MAHLYVPLPLKNRINQARDDERQNEKSSLPTGEAFHGLGHVLACALAVH